MELSSSSELEKPRATSRSVGLCCKFVEVACSHAERGVEEVRKASNLANVYESCAKLVDSTVPHEAKDKFAELQHIWRLNGLDHDNVQAVSGVVLTPLKDVLAALFDVLRASEPGPTSFSPGIDLHGSHWTRGGPLATNASGKVSQFLQSSLLQAQSTTEAEAKDLSKEGTSQNFQHDISNGHNFQLCTH